MLVFVLALVLSLAVIFYSGVMLLSDNFTTKGIKIALGVILVVVTITAVICAILV